VRFDYGSADGNFLYPLNILSNSTTFLHTEQMIDLGGSLQFAFVDDSQSKFTLDNKSKYSWTSVAAFRRNSNGLLEAAWINTLPADSSTRAEFSSADMTQVANHWKWRESDRQRPTLQTDESPEKFSALMRAISGLAFMRAGEIRVIAFANGTVNGLQVEPATGSSLKYSALVLHVQCGKYPTPEPDRSLPSRQMSAEAQKRELEGSAGDDEVISAPESEDNSNEPKQP
jgi:hypothetical protein